MSDAGSSNSQVEHVQTQRDIQALLEAEGIRPRKRFGQNFLIDGNLMRRLVASAELEPHDLVIEVGGGTGGLTDLLAKHAGRVVCFEIDRGLHAILAVRFNRADHVQIRHGDVLQSKHVLCSDLSDAIAAHAGSKEGGVKLVANLPYQVATPLVMNLLLGYPQVRRLCFTVQAEVGDRLTASPGCKAYGPLSIVTQMSGQAKTVARIAPQAFWPRPAVDSVMLRLDVVDGPLRNSDERLAFAQLLRNVFAHRRKALRTALAYAVDDEVKTRICQSFDGGRRPESLTVAEWLDVFALTRG